MRMEHPLMGFARASGLATGTGTTLTHMTLTGDEYAGLARRSTMFYSQSLSLARFLAATYGDGYIRTLADRLVAAADPEHPVFAPEELARLQQSWEEWAGRTAR
jgi:hypothetical protein